MDIIEKKIIESFIKPTNKKPNHFLYNTEKSMKMFDKIKLELFKFKEKIYEKTDKTQITRYYIESYNITSSILENKLNYKTSLMLGKSFEENINIKIDIYEEIIKIKNINETKKNKLLTYEINIGIPIYICSEGMLSNGDKYFPNFLESGGYFICKGNIKKYVVYKEDKLTTWPKHEKKKKNNFYHISFSSYPLRFESRFSDPQFLIMDLNLNLDNFYLIISSKKIIPDIDVLLFISYLTNFDLETLRDYLISRFYNKDNNIYYDYKILDIIYLIYYNSKNILKNQTLDDYINNVFNTFLKKINNTKEEIINKLFPCINDYFKIIEKNNYDKKKIKGIKILLILENFLIASFQNQIYPSRDEFFNRRISSPGTTFENICIEGVKKLIKDYKDYVQKISDKNEISTKTYNKIENIFKNVFNMQDNKFSLVIKPHKNINNLQKYINNNLVVWDSSINLTKYIKMRDPNLLTWQFMGPSDTPDHGEKVGINRRLNIQTIINDKDYEIHKKLFIQIHTFFNEFINRYEKCLYINKYLDYKDIVSVCLIDDSEIFLGFITQELSLVFYKELLEKKINNFFIDNLIDVSLIPYYKFTELKIFLPIEKYMKIRINIGNKICFVPVYIIKDGVLVLEKFINDENFKKDLKNVTFEELNFKYKIIEFIGPEQFAYSQIIENIELFNKLDDENKKKINYIAFNNYLNLSILETLIFDIGKMPGTRGIFSSSQLKNSISSILPDSINSLEASKFTMSGYQEPCLTNKILLESTIAKQSFGTHCLVAFMSYNDNIEDSIILNKNSIDNGLFSMLNVLLYKGEFEFSNNLVLDVGIKKGSVKSYKLDDDGIPFLNIFFKENDVIYGSTETRLKKDNVYFLKENSKIYKFIKSGRVDRILSFTDESEISIRLILYVHHFLERGHKISNQCAQKSTISKILDSDKIPYNKDGVKPDIIMNSLSLISRKTLNMYYQSILTNIFNYVPIDDNNKKRLLNYFSFSNFKYENLEECKKILKEFYNDFDDETLENIFNCEETLYDPYTCEKIKTKIFLAPIYFIRLFQISEEKISAKNRGKLNKLEQPPSGKQKGGTHKIGEMEIDILSTHGVANILYEISLDSMEVQKKTLICKNCCNIATKIINTNTYSCLNCSNIQESSLLETFVLNKTSKILLGLCNFRGIKMSIIYNDVSNIYRKNK